MIKKCLLSFFLLFVIIKQGNAQFFWFAAKNVRDSVTANLRSTINSTVSGQLNEQNLNRWQGAFWAMELLLYKPKAVRKKIPGIIKGLHTQPAFFQQSFLEMLITLYPGKFKSQLKGVWKMLGSDKVKVMALEQLALANSFPELNSNINFSGSGYYDFYSNKWFGPKPVFPEKESFLDKDFLKGQTVLVSFQYRNRDKPGCLMIRTAGHQWMKDEKGNLLCFKQLARSITNMPWYITNGNTAQGLYKITGTDISANNWIGPTTNLQLVMPFEESVQPFYSDTTASLEQYKNLLGPLSPFNGLFESYYAGKTGRSEIIAHGTTIPEWYYKNKTYYPCTPSLGCLCSPEIWNEKGELEISTQNDWMKVYRSLIPKPAYFVVAEIREDD